MNTLGDRIRTIREQRSLLSHEAAALAGMSPQRWSNLERGQRQRVTPETLRRLARALGVTVDELLR